MDNVIGILIFGMVALMLLALFLTAQASLFSTSSEVRKKVHAERARSKENVRIYWLSDKEILITNNGPRDTVIRYIYMYYEGSDVPSLYVPLNIELKVGESKRVNLETLILASGTGNPLNGLPHSKNGKKYYLCYDGFSSSNPRDYETECFTEDSSEFPSKDKLDSGIEGYSLFRNRSSHRTLQAILQELNNVGGHWTACVWLKINLSSGNKDFSLIKFHNDVYLNYDKDLDVIYAEIVRMHRVSHLIELGLSKDNPSNPSEWGLYCITINRTEGECGCKATIKFYVNGVLIDSANIPYHPQFKLFKVEIPANSPFDYWIDNVYLTNETLNDGEIKMLLNLDKPPSWNINFSFDYGLKELNRVDVITDLGNVFSSTRPREAIIGVPSPGG